MNRRLALLLGGGLALALLQQQLLLRRPPRLLELNTSSASSGPAALDLLFSRPMTPPSLAAASRLDPPLAHQWLGEGNPMRLLLTGQQPLTGPIQLLLAGLDRRGLALRPERWLWDPRPWLLVVAPVGGGEQLQLQGRDGRWMPLTPVLNRITALRPLGDGSGVALVSGERLWLVPLEQRSLRPAGPKGAAPWAPLPGQRRALLPEPLLYAHLSSNRRGDLLAQWSSRPLGRATTSLWPRGQRPQQLPLEAFGPIQLLPEGGGLVVPELEGLSLQPLPGRPPRRQLLPGSRDLSSFCPLGGRALLMRHWPDYRRSLELVEPGQPPRQLWLGQEAVLGSACERGGERSWLLLSDWQSGASSQLLELSRSGQTLRRRSLAGWAAEPGSPMLYDPTRRQLLLTLRARGAQEPQPVFIDAGSLQLRPIAKAARQALWLAPG
jgi:hypothetical protein